jgi:hypothetical protein
VTNKKMAKMATTMMSNTVSEESMAGPFMLW